MRRGAVAELEKEKTEKTHQNRTCPILLNMNNCRLCVRRRRKRNQPLPAEVCRISKIERGEERSTMSSFFNYLIADESTAGQRTSRRRTLAFLRSSDRQRSSTEELQEQKTSRKDATAWGNGVHLMVLTFVVLGSFLLVSSLSTRLLADDKSVGRPVGAAS
jgi:Fe-S-cluster-containing dehydrogenase component